MVQKAIVVDLCDKCMPDETPATVVLTAQINGTEYKLDLCGEHSVQTAVSDIALYGRTDGPTPTGGTKVKIPCPMCGKQYSKGSGMALHMKAAHGPVNRVAV